MYFFHILSIVFYDKNVLKIHKNEKCLLRLKKKNIIFRADHYFHFGLLLAEHFNRRTDSKCIRNSKSLSD